MDRNMHFSIPYLPLRLRLECCEAASLPQYLGSALHGVLGWTLLSHRQAYQYIYENRRLGGAAQDIVNPYIIDPPGFHGQYKPGDELCFQIILIGEAMKYSGELIRALIEGGTFGLGAERKKFVLTEIMQGKQMTDIWKKGQMSLPERAQPETLTEDETLPECSHCSIALRTPLRIRRKGALVMDLDFPAIIRNITRRMSELTARYGGFVNQEEMQRLQELTLKVQRTSSGLYLCKIDRYSSRHEEKMDWSGLMGAMTFEGDLVPFIPWLNAAEVLHIGRNVTLGYGKIDVIFC